MNMFIRHDFIWEKIIIVCGNPTECSVEILQNVLWNYDSEPLQKLTENAARTPHDLYMNSTVSVAFLSRLYEDSVWKFRTDPRKFIWNFPHNFVKILYSPFIGISSSFRHTQLFWCLLDSIHCCLAPACIWTYVFSSFCSDSQIVQ